jgi:hypothetical protein
MITLTAADFELAYYCAGRELRRWELADKPVPTSIQRPYDILDAHYNLLDAQISVSNPGHESACGVGKSKELDKWITAREAGAIIGTSGRTRGDAGPAGAGGVYLDTPAAAARPATTTDSAAEDPEPQPGAPTSADARRVGGNPPSRDRHRTAIAAHLMRAPLRRFRFFRCVRYGWHRD